jgi:hypothetical protein
MTVPERRLVNGATQILGKLFIAVALASGVIGVGALVAVSPFLIDWFYRGGDWTQPGNVGQAYGAASAVLAALALGLVCMSLILQRGQFRRHQRSVRRDCTRDIVKLALEEPAYAQCWGSRFAPGHVDERLFFYTNFVILNWSFAWEEGDLTEQQARTFLGSFFASEVPRMFWERHGQLHHPRLALTRAERFIAMVNEEYLRAIRKGPPTRPYEPMHSAPVVAPSL